VAVAVGLVLTLAPLILPSSTEFLHWPLLLVDRHLNSLVPLNAGKRLIFLFLINTVVWAVCADLVFSVFYLARTEYTARSIP